MTFAYGEVVTRLRAARSADPYSEDGDILDWTYPSRLDLPHCAVALAGSVESVEVGRNPLDSDFDVYMPFGSDVTAADRLEVRGLTCNIVGRPFDWLSPLTGWQAGLVVHAKIREG